METIEPHRLAHVIGLLPKQAPRRKYKFNRPSFIYLIRCEKCVKVGIADDPVRRVLEMQTGNPFPLKLEHAWPTNNAYQAEQCLHIELRDKHHAGEWFRLTKNEVKALIRSHPQIDLLIPVDGEVY